MRRTITALLVLITVTAVLTYGLFWGGGKAASVGPEAATHGSAITDPLTPPAGTVKGTPFDPAAISRVQAALAKSGKSPVVAAPAVGAATYATGLERIPHEPPKPGEIRTLAIKQLGNFEFDPTTSTDVPPDVKALNGMTVRLNGFMFPLTNALKVSEFILVPSLTSCCYGQPPGVQHVITVHLPKDKGIDPVTDEVVVEGTLVVNVVREDDYTNSIFEVKATSVKLAQ